ncbi:MAG TPA: hypothetical protein EYH56_01965 [Nanoarchaeota archaeon]|nr:hypothetical protein [Nanoarchaeota archaeon]
MEVVIKNIPLLKKKEWAGKILEKFKGEKNIGESWEVSTHFSGVSNVLYKERKIPLNEFVKKFENVFGFSEFPIMVKFLDVGKILSVQVHPSDEIAKELGENDKGKSEGWISLSEGKVYLGAKDYSKEITLENLKVFEAKPFDTFPIPAGMVHTAENILLLEVSTPSNLTYRIYDPYGREVHIDKAKKCIKPIESKKDSMKLEMQQFYAEVIEINEEKNFMDEKVNVLVALDEIEVESKNSVKLKKYESCIILPGNEYIVKGKGFVVRIYPKD